MKNNLLRKYEWITPLPNYIVGAIWIGFGLVYLFKDSFMSYHAVAISSSWEELKPRISNVDFGTYACRRWWLFLGWNNDYTASKNI